MSPQTMVWTSVVLSAIAQVSLKHGLTRVKLRATGSNSSLALVGRVATEVWVWIWASCFVVATALWLLGVQRLDLSYAFPLLSVGYLLVTFLSLIFFRERVDGMRWLAVLVICAGVVLIARS